MTTQKYLALLCTGLLACSLKAESVVSEIEGASSGTTVTVSGTYTITDTKIEVPAGVTVKGPATFNFTKSTTYGFFIDSGVSGVKLESLTITGGEYGICTKGTKGLFESCNTNSNGNTGIEVIDGDATDNTVSDCVSYNNIDSTGGNADGVTPKAGCGSGNVIENCTAYGNSDDGFDSEKATAPVAYSGCLSYTNGYAGGKQGNGNGFKMGIGGDDIAHTYTSCTAHNETGGNSPKGFSTNGNTGAIKLTSCHSYSNGIKDELGNCVLSNCTMQTSNL